MIPNIININENAISNSLNVLILVYIKNVPNISSYANNYDSNG